DQGDDPVGRGRAVGPLDPLRQGEAGAPAAPGPGDDPQRVALVAGLPEVEVDVHHHRDRSQVLQAVVGEAVAVVPLPPAPLHILDVLRLVDVAVDVDLGAANHDLQDDFHGFPRFSDLLRYSTKMSTIDPRTKLRSGSPLRRGHLARILMREFIAYSFSWSR